MGEDDEAQNYDKKHRLVRSLLAVGRHCQGGEEEGDEDRREQRKDETRRDERQTRKNLGKFEQYRPAARRSLFSGSRGPMLRKATGLDWAGDKLVMPTDGGCAPPPL